MVSLVPYFLAAPTHTKNLNNSNSNSSNDKKKDSSETSTRRSETSDRVTS